MKVLGIGNNVNLSSQLLTAVGRKLQALAIVWNGWEKQEKQEKEKSRTPIRMCINFYCSKTNYLIAYTDTPMISVSVGQENRLRWDLYLGSN